MSQALKQCRADINAFLTINPDFSREELGNIKFRSRAFLVATENKHQVCRKCSEYVIFREDLNSEARQSRSLAKNLYQDMVAQDKEHDNKQLREKLGLDAKPRPPTDQAKQTLLRISSRYVGLASLYPIKSCREYQKKKEKDLKHVDKKVSDPDNLGEALYLNTRQMVGLIGSFCLSLIHI